MLLYYIYIEKQHWWQAEIIIFTVFRLKRVLFRDLCQVATVTVPGKLKMVMNEATVLEEVVKYIKQLQERVKTLEQQMNPDNTNESHALPQIEAKVWNRNVRIRILCAKCKGVLVRAHEEIEKLNLCVVSSSAMPFGISLLDISLIAQMDGEFMMTGKDLVESLRASLSQFIGENLPQDKSLRIM